MTPDLSPWDVAAAAALLLVNAGLSLVLGLGLARSLLVAGARMVVQLGLLALVLRTLFLTENPALTGAAMVVMAGFAGNEILARQERVAGRLWTAGLGAAAMLAAGWLITLPALALLVRADPWWSPRVALPMFGMVAGNAMTGISLALRSLVTTLTRDARAIEARLALGATRAEALGPALREALRTGLLPTINAMAAIGVVTIPGMMTGQLLGGADPMVAARYQMLIMFLIAGTSALALTAMVFALARRLSDDRHRLRLDRLGPPRGTGLPRPSRHGSPAKPLDPASDRG